MLGGTVEIAVEIVESARYARLAIVDERMPGWVLSCVVEGRVETKTDGWTGHAGPGDVMVHPPRRPFSERSEEGGLHLWRRVRARADGAELGERLGLRLLHRAPSAAGLLSTARDAVGALEFLRAVAEGPSDAPTARAAPARFGALNAAMEADPARPWTRDDLAVLAAMHPAALDRAFRRETGVTPRAELGRVRLALARRLLRETELPLAAIAARCGLSDASALTKAFVRAEGVTPGAWRVADVRSGYG